MSEAIEQLRNHQRQLDAEGIFVGVSRQALEETLEQITALQAERDLAIKELTTVVNSMKEYLFPDNHSFIPLTDIRGLVSQADNISCQIPVVLAELAALKAAQRWIPCSEELPPLDTPVLVQSNPYADCITITCAMRYDDGDGWLWGQLTGYNPILNRPESYEFDDDYDYLAWMPLPTPPAGQEVKS